MRVMANSFTAHAGPGNGSAPGAPAAASVAAPAGIVPGGSDGTTVHFFSSFEPGDPRPRSDGQDGTGSGVTTSVGAGPDHAPAAKAQVGFSGGSALAYAGRAADAGSAHARVRLFDVRIEVNADTELSYVLFPEFTAGDLGYPRPTRRSTWSSPTAAT